MAITKWIKEDWKKPWGKQHTVLLLVIIPAAAVLVSWFVTDARTAWVMVVVLLTLWGLLAGVARLHLVRGLFIDKRNKVSLSKLQAFIWTVIVVGAFLVAGLANTRLEEDEPLLLAVPEELWIVMGISLTSLLGSPLIKATKAAKVIDDKYAKTKLEQAQVLPAPSPTTTPEPIAATGSTTPETDAITPAPETPAASTTELERAGGNILKQGENVHAEGALEVNPTSKQSSWGDMFDGEEIGNFTEIDLGKVQMFYFTLILAVTYALAVGRMFSVGGPFNELPSLDDSMIALLAISHGAYLANKTVPRTPSPSPPGPTG